MDVSADVVVLHGEFNVNEDPGCIHGKSSRIRAKNVQKLNFFFKIQKNESYRFLPQNYTHTWQLGHGFETALRRQ